jgi:hypothetical protein
VRTWFDDLRGLQSLNRSLPNIEASSPIEVDMLSCGGALPKASCEEVAGESVWWWWSYSKID